MNNLSTNWKKLSSKVLLKNEYLEIREDEVLRPDGKTSKYYYQNRDPFSIVIPLNGEVVSLVCQYRYTVNSLSWEFPMGYVEGKNPYDSAVTELKEETGMTADRLTEIGKFWKEVGGSNQFAYVYLAEGLHEGEPMPEDGEFLEVKEFTISEVGGMIRRGEILDGPTIAAYQYLIDYLKNI